MESLELYKYKSLNKSFNKKLIYGVGIFSGFFSEINIMILAVLYCLHHKIQFKLHSSNANFRFNKGWQDYFLPFCPEVNNHMLDLYNKRHKINYLTDFKKPRRMLRKNWYELMVLNTKFISHADFLTFDLWHKIANRDIEKIHFKIDELGIDGDLQHACNKVVRFIWNFNPEIQELIDNKLTQIELPDKYIGFHIRRGDKCNESDYIPIEKYFKETEKRTDIRNIFVMTDDFSIIRQLKKEYRGWNIITLCREDEDGYKFKDFYSQSRKQIYEGIITLLINIEILRRSELLAGTFSSNPSMFLGMIMEKEKVISLDIPWQVWL